MDYSLFSDQDFLWHWHFTQDRCWRGDMNAYPLLQRIWKEAERRRISYSGQRY